MTPPNSIFWSISRKENLSSRQRHALTNKFLRTLFCSNDNINPWCNRKMLIRKKTSFLDELCFDYEQSLHTVQCTTEKYVILTQLKSSFRKEHPLYCRFEINLIFAEVKIASVTVHNLQLVCIGLEVYTF